jgi:hypothetical protein
VAQRRSLTRIVPSADVLGCVVGFTYGLEGPKLKVGGETVKTTGAGGKDAVRDQATNGTLAGVGLVVQKAPDTAPGRRTGNKT